MRRRAEEGRTLNPELGHTAGMADAIRALGMITLERNDVDGATLHWSDSPIHDTGPARNEKNRR